MPEESKSRQAEAPPRRNRSEPVARGAMALGTEALARAGFRDPTLVLRWAEIAGPEAARLCRPVKLSHGQTGGVLTLKAEPGAAVFLHHESRALCDRLNGFLGRSEIVRLRFLEGQLADRPKPRSRHPAPGPVPHLDPALAFRGPEPLREALVKLARRRAARTFAD